MSIEAPPTPAAKPNPAQRLGGVVVAPDATLRDIAARPDWLVPLLLSVVVSVVFGLIMIGHVDFETSMREQMERRGATASDMDAAEMEMAVKIQRIATPIVLGVMGVIVPLIVAAVLLLAGKVFGGEGRFKQVFGVTVYSWVPQILKAVILAVLLARVGTIGAEQMGLLLRSNLGFLTDHAESPALFALLSSFDVFTIWTVVLLSLGLTHSQKLSRGTAFGIVIGLWALVILGKVGIAAAFGGGAS